MDEREMDRHEEEDEDGGRLEEDEGESRTDSSAAMRSRLYSLGTTSSGSPFQYSSLWIFQELKDQQEEATAAVTASPPSKYSPSSPTPADLEDEGSTSTAILRLDDQQIERKKKHTKQKQKHKHKKKREEEEEDEEEVHVLRLRTKSATDDDDEEEEERSFLAVEKQKRRIQRNDHRALEKMELGELSLQGGDGVGDSASSTGEVIVERDYSMGTIPRFETHFPQQLQGRVGHEDFEHTLSTINGFFYDSEHLTPAQCLESLLGCLSFYTLYLCMDAKYTKNMNRLAAFLESENNRVYKPAGLLLLNPLSNGLLYLQILDFNNKQSRDSGNTLSRTVESTKDV